MKKVICILLIMPLLINILRNNKDTIVKEYNKEEVRGVFVSYIEVSKYLKDVDEVTSKNNIIKIIENIKNLNCNTIILQVRPSSDAIYYSETFPLSKYLTDTGEYPYDVLEYFITESKKQNIDLYAWINPYRVSTTSNIEEIKENNPAYKYINTDTCYIKDGIYYNPSKKEVEELIIRGVEEVLEYEIKGLIFDDYFYPCEEIDINDYHEYLKNNSKISIKEYHLNIINRLIKKVYEKCHSKNILFGVSPDGNIDNNYNMHYADVKKWVEEENYIDIIMPQIYYGFNNSNKPFRKTLLEWNNMIKNKNIALIPALALYKSGKSDKYAKDGINEWIEENDIIMKQIIISRNVSNYRGFVLYRYENIFEEESKKELKNVKKILK